MNPSTLPHNLASVSATCVCLNARQLSRQLSRIYDQALAPAGLKSTQFGLLVAVGCYDVVSVTDLAATLILEQTTLTRNLALLKRRGLVSMQPDTRDARRRLMSLTEQGRQTLATALPLWQTAQHMVAARFDTAALVQHMQELVAATRDTVGAP